MKKFFSRRRMPEIQHSPRQACLSMACLSMACLSMACLSMDYVIPRSGIMGDSCVDDGLISGLLHFLHESTFRHGGSCGGVFDGEQAVLNEVI